MKYVYLCLNRVCIAIAKYASFSFLVVVVAYTLHHALCTLTRDFTLQSIAEVVVFLSSKAFVHTWNTVWVCVTSLAVDWLGELPATRLPWSKSNVITHFFSKLFFPQVRDWGICRIFNSKSILCMPSDNFEFVRRMRYARCAPPLDRTVLYGCVVEMVSFQMIIMLINSIFVRSRFVII